MRMTDSIFFPPEVITSKGLLVLFQFDISNNIFPYMGMVCHQHYPLIWLNMTLLNSSRGVLSRVYKLRKMWDQTSLYNGVKAKLGLPWSWKSTPKKHERGDICLLQLWRSALTGWIPSGNNSCILWCMSIRGLSGQVAARCALTGSLLFI